MASLKVWDEVSQTWIKLTGGEGGDLSVENQMKLNDAVSKTELAANTGTIIVNGGYF